MSDKILEDLDVDLHDSPGVLPNEKDFTQGTRDSYAIYQLKAIPENHSLLFARLVELKQPVQMENYELVYTGPLPDVKMLMITQFWKTCSYASICAGRKTSMGAV